MSALLPFAFALCFSGVASGEGSICAGFEVGQEFDQKGCDALRVNIAFAKHFDEDAGLCLAVHLSQ